MNLNAECRAIDVGENKRRTPRVCRRPKHNTRIRKVDGQMVLDRKPLPEMPDDLKKLFEEKK